ncbi:MAG: CDP-diacylglycerol--glycerol-3-phosphate 3-phosphatidyltransferase [Gammaproteobacteria bacterium]|nr:CDP-diacylglycerol--glycerol-3-phosphate 3-phosphatidyltransferase [Gammaproteobacteria bacterium]
MKPIVLSLPNWLTLTRIFIIPFFVVAFYLPFSFAKWLAAGLFCIACFTDWLDGYLARRLEQSSSFGAFLDPVADKLLVSTSLLMLVGSQNIAYITLPAIVIVGREIVISALREWMAEMGTRVSVAVSYMGKIKTGVQMVAIFLLIAYTPSQSLWGLLGIILLYIAAGLTMWSMVIYLTVAWPELVGRKENCDSLVDRH